MKYTQISFVGMTDVPADAFCQNGEMELLGGVICEDGMLRPANYPEIVGAENDESVAVGTLKVMPGADGIQFASARDNSSLGYGPEFPCLTFGLELAGMLSLPNAYELPASMVPTAASGGSGEGAWTVHPSAKPSQADDSAAACRLINKSIATAIDRQIHAQGFFYQPFFVRYALRMHDGDVLVMPSAPVLLLPGTMPPCVAVDSVIDSDDTEHKLVVFSSTSFKYFRLRCYVASGIDPRWRDRVAAIDVFVSEPISTYDADSVTDVGIVAYSSMCGGREYMGRWSDGGESYSDRYLADSGLASARVWDLAPNHALEQDIKSPREYYLVASLSVADINAGRGGFDVPVASTAAAAIRKGKKMVADAITHCRFAPDAVTAYCGELWIGGGRVRVANPLPLSTLMPMAATDEYAEASESTAVSVHQAQRCVAHISEGAGAAPSLAMSMPRYLWHPDADASSLTVRQGGIDYAFPLTSCADGDGAYWFGGFGKVEANDFACGGVDRSGSAYYSAPSHVFAGDPLCMKEKCVVGNGRVAALKSALAAVSAGQFGQYPLYAFADDGIWALTLDGTCRKVCADVCVGRDKMCVADRGVAYVSGRGVMMLEGGKSVLLSGALRLMRPLRLDKLPRLAEVTEISALPSLASVVPECALAYDAATGRLWVIGKGVAYAYSVDSRTWGVAIPESGVSTGEGHRWLLITRALKLAAVGERVRLASVEAAGALCDARGGMILYGSNDMVRWSIVGSTYGRRISGIAGSGWRYYKIAIDARVPEGESIDGLIIGFD